MIVKLMQKANAILALDRERCAREEIFAAFAEFSEVPTGGQGILGIAIDCGSIWHRGRRVEAGEPIQDNLEELIYPKTPSGEYRRASFPGQRVFYASSNRFTVLAEIAPEPGDKVQFIMCRVRPESKIICSIIGAYEYFYQSGRSFFPHQLTEKFLTDFFFGPSADKQRTNEVLWEDAFLASLFRQRDPTFHRLTSVIAQPIHASREPSGLLYPSVRNVAGLNLAVPDWVFDECFEVLAADVIEIKKSYGFGIYDESAYRPLTNAFQTDGTIEWERKLIPNGRAVTKATGFNARLDGPTWGQPIQLSAETEEFLQQVAAARRSEQR